MSDATESLIGPGEKPIIEPSSRRSTTP